MCIRDSNLPFTNRRLLRGAAGAAVGGHGDVVGDAQLRRVQLQGADDGRRVAQRPGMDEAAQPPPDNDAARGHDLRAGVDLSLIHI